MSSLGIFVTLGIPLLFGAGVLRCFGWTWREERLAFVGWAYLVGGLLTAGAVLLVLACGLGRWSAALAPVLGLLAVGTIAWSFRRDSPSAPSPRGGAPLWEEAVFALALTIAVGVSLMRFVAATLSPVHQGDEGAIWACKAKALFVAQGFGRAFREVTHEIPHADYPLLNPLLQVWTFFQAGTILHVENRFVVQGFFIALLFVLAASLRRYVRPVIAAVFLVQLVAMYVPKFYGHRVESDVMVALGWLVSLDALLRWRAGEARAWPLLWLGLTFLVASKNEGYFYLVALAGGLFLAQLQHGTRTSLRRPAWALVCLPFGAILLHQVMNLSLGFENDLVVGGPEQLSLVERLRDQALPRLGEVVSYLVHDIAFEPGMGGYWIPVAGLLLLLAPRLALGRQRAFLTTTLLLVSVGVVVVYVLSQRPLERHLPTSAGRFVFQSLPVLALWIASMVGELWPGVRTPSVD